MSVPEVRSRVKVVMIARDTTYTYDADGLRQSKTTGATTTRYTWDHNGSLPMLLSDGANYYVYDNTGNPLEQINISSGAVTWLHHDQLGTTRLLTNSTGTTVGTATYDPYGNQTATTGSATSPLGYNGQYTDTETGLIYLRHRYYDPTTAQFLTIDPLVAITGAPYSYVGNSPLNGADPTGLCKHHFWCNPINFVQYLGTIDPAPSVDDQLKYPKPPAEDSDAEQPQDDPSHLCTSISGTGEVTTFADKAAARAGLEGDLQAAGNRFFRGATAKSYDFQATAYVDGNTKMQFFSPADNPGYGKLYVQTIDSNGNIVSEYKDTLGPDGLLERKWIHGGP